MKIRTVSSNNHKREFAVVTHSGRVFEFPYARADPIPTPDNRICRLYVDKELGSEAFTYSLASGAEGSVHIDDVKEYAEDPEYMADLLVYKLTLEAKRALERSGISQRRIAKRLKTSLPQLHRLLDPSNSEKSMKQLVALLHLLGCEIDLVVREPC